MTGWDKRPTGRALAGGAWKSLGGMAKKMPLVLGLGLVAGALFNGALLGVPLLHTAAILPKPEDFSTATLLPHLGYRLVYLLGWSVLGAPLAVTMHRYVLLGEVPHLPVMTRQTRTFFLWLVGLQLAVLVARLFPLVMSAVMFVRGLSEFLISVGVLIAALWIAMIFPAMAVDEPSASAEKRIDTSFQRMDGHVWLLVRGAFLAFLPFAGLLFLIARITVRAAKAGTMAHMLPLLGAVAGLVQVVWILVGAALLSWLFAWVRRD